MAQTNFSKKLMENGILNCGLCRNLLTPPVYLHNTLGNVCHKCVDLTSTSTKECMQNSCLDFILNELTFPCKFQDEGCREYLSRELLRSHQQKCKFRTMECWLAIKKCTWIGQPKKFEEHFIECHKEHIVDIKNDLFVFNVNININNVLTVKMLRKSRLKSYFFKMTKNNLNMLYALYTTENFKKCESICISHIGKNAEVVSTVCMTQTLNDTKINFAEVSLAVLSKMTEANKTLYLILKSENNKEFDKKYLENFECPICSNLMRSPIYQCKTGHSFCHLCKPKLRQCPTCRGSISNLRNYSLEALTTKLIYECKNKNFGCEERLTADEIEEHEIICDCHKEPCPLKDDTNCLFKGSPADIAVHFTHSHNGEFFDVRTNTYKNVLILPDVSFTKYLIDAENNIFSLVSKGKNKGLEWNLKVLQKINEDDSFVYEIGFTHPTQNRRKFIRRNLISEKYYFTFDDVEEYFEDQYDLPPTKKLYYYCKINVAKG